jgi:F-type H+-transporting ATPase subunit alpha
MQAFAMFASDLDPASRQQLTRGARLMELLKQKQYTPYPVEDQVVSIWAGTNGHLDEVEVADVLDFEQALLEHVRRTTNVMDSIVGSGKLEDDAVAALETAVAEVKRDFRGTKHGIEPGHEEHEPLDASAVDQERIVRK